MRYTEPIEFADVVKIREARPRARVPHQCNDCGEIIPAGERYELFVGVVEGIFVALTTHDRYGRCPRFFVEECPYNS